VIVASLLIIPFLLVLFDSFFRALFLVVAIAPFRQRKKRRVNAKMQELSLLILVVANNEERIIGQTLQLILETINSVKYVTLALLADNCTDQTAQIAEDLRVKTYIRVDNDTGKGKALSWFALSHSEIVETADIIVILDADTIIDKDFHEKMVKAFSPTVDVVQSFVSPINSGLYFFTTLASFSELLSQYIDDRARSILSWTIPLRGTGMAFRSTIFCSLCSGLTTQVDDIELSIRLADMGIKVFFEPEAIVFDPKSSNMLGLARQRGRWLKGQRQVFSLMKSDLRKLLLSGFSGWSLMQALLFKPKTLLLTIKIFLIFILWFIIINPLRSILEIGLLTSVLIDLLYYFIGLKYVSERKMYLSALLKAPLYLVLWFAGWFFSFNKKRSWLRARE
jgi:cellulose synthase/poly-beta-1,6-N-acetylglucosamine synthase-like glycosyltransferase